MLQDYIDSFDYAPIGWVREDAPLLSNLNILENIALIEQVHYHTPAHQALSHVKEKLNRLQSYNIALLRPSQCNEQQLFLAQLIRAGMLQNAPIKIVTPFSLISNMKSIDIVFDMIEDLKLQERTEIIDISFHKNRYFKGETRCHIAE